MAKETPLTDGSVRALEALKSAGKAVALNELNEMVDEPIASAHLTALKRRGLVSTSQAEVPVTRMQKVNVYSISE